MNWLRLNRLYIRAANSDDQDTLRRFFDESSDDPRFFTRRCYIWNIIRGKEFCRIVAEWAIDWYRRLADYARADVEIETAKEAEQTLVETLHRIISTETHENIKRSLVWKITKYAPIITIDTLPYISEERLLNIINSMHCLLSWNAESGTN